MRTAPWAYPRGVPFRAIAALELYATLLCVVLFGSAWPRAGIGALGLTGITDNQGNTFSLARLMSGKFPVVVILTELAMQLRERSMELSLEWVPRDQNEEADALTNGDFTLFDPARRISVDPTKLEWIVLPRMMEVAENLYKETQAARAASGGPLPREPRRRPEEVLRRRDPW